MPDLKPVKVEYDAAPGNMDAIRASYRCDQHKITKALQSRRQEQTRGNERGLRERQGDRRLIVLQKGLTAGGRASVHDSKCFEGMLWILWAGRGVSHLTGTVHKPLSIVFTQARPWAHQGTVAELPPTGRTLRR
ncbi:MAG: hypothetical protein M3294_04470 [Pseudomonadota bacterium]|nr:hypothetical protein [Pseudomonadota bacterium]